MYNDIPKLPITHPEIKSEPPTVMAVIATKEPIDDLINYYSSWDRLKRAVTWLKRFLKVLQKKAQPSAYLTADEVTNAEQCIIKHVQTSAFSADMKRLVSGRTLPIHSPLHRLDPYIDDDGLLVGGGGGGRLRHSGLQLSAKHPCILPYRHPVSSFVARSVHERCHLGREWVVSLIRKSYWIINVRSLVYKTCKDCVTCKKLFAPSAVQKMADLLKSYCSITSFHLTKYQLIASDHIQSSIAEPPANDMVVYSHATCSLHGRPFLRILHQWHAKVHIQTWKAITHQVRQGHKLYCC